MEGWEILETAFTLEDSRNPRSWRNLEILNNKFIFTFMLA